MGEIVLVNELVLRDAGSGFRNDPGQFGVVLECEEDRFDVGVLDADVDHPVVLLVLAGQLVLLDDAGGIVVGMGAEHDAVLRTAAHRLGIDIVFLLVLAHQPSFLLPGPEVLHGAVVRALLVLAGDRVEVDLGLGDVQQGLLPGHPLRFFRVQDIIGRRRDLRHDAFGRPQRRKRFDSYHSFELIYIRRY